MLQKGKRKNARQLSSFLEFEVSDGINVIAVAKLSAPHPRFCAGNRGLSVLSVPTYTRCVPTYEREQR